MALDWFIFALASTLIWSLGAIIQKFVRVNYIKSPIGYLVITAPVTLYSLIFLLFGELTIPAPLILFYILITSITAFIGYWLYLIAIHKEEISKITTLQGLGPLIMLILAIIFLQEVLTMKDYIAFPLIIAGGMLISLKKVEEKFKLSPGFFIILLSLFFFSIQSLFFKLASEVNFTTMMILRQFGFLIIISILFILFKEIRTKAKQDLKQLNKKRLCLIFTAEIVGMTGLAFSYLAIQRGPVSLVALVQGTQALFVIALATLVSIFIPKILKEEINKKTISLKIISALLMIAGLYLIII